MGMEDDTRGFFVMILNTLSVVFIWMMANVIAGIYFGLAFFEVTPGWKNYIYYAAFISSLFFLVKYVSKKWKS